VNLRGFQQGGQAMEPAVAVRGFLDALGVPAERIPHDLDAQALLYRSVLAGNRLARSCAQRGSRSALMWLANQWIQWRWPGVSTARDR
jgi:hypothetical protein